MNRTLILIKDCDITKDMQFVGADLSGWNGTLYARLSHDAQKKTYDKITTYDIADSARAIHAANLVKLPNGKVLKNRHGSLN